MTDPNTGLDPHDLPGTSLDALNDSHNRERLLDTSTLNTIVDSERLSYLIAPSDPSELTVQTTSKVIENEIHSFLNSFCTTSLQTNTVPILIFPQHLGKIVNKCIRYYASICSLAPFYIDVHGVNVLAACSNEYLRAHHVEDYNNLFLSRPEDCEDISVSHLFNCIIENKMRNNLRRNLLREFQQENLISEASNPKPSTFLMPEDSSTSNISQKIVKHEKKECKFIDDIVQESNLNINAQEFIPQNQCVKSNEFEDSDLVVTNEISTIYSFVPIPTVKTDSNLTHPYLFTPDPTCKDFVYNSDCFKLGSTSSNSTPTFSFDPLLSFEKSGDSTHSDVNRSLSKSLLKHDDSYYLTRRKYKDNKHSSSKHSMTEPVIHSNLSITKYAELVSSLPAESSKEKSSPESAPVLVTKNLEEEDSLTSLPQFSRDPLVPSAPKYFTSTPKPESVITQENIPPFTLSFGASTSSDLNTDDRSSMELIITFNDDHSSTTENVVSIQQPDSPISVSEGSEKQLENYEQPSSSVTSSSSYEQVFQPSSNIIESPTASTSLVYYTAEVLSSSTDLSRAQFTLSSSILSPRIDDIIPASLLSIQPTPSAVDFETPLAPTRYSPLQLKAITASDSAISSSILSLFSSNNSQDKTTATSMDTSFVATSLTPISTAKKSDSPEEFTSTRSTTFEKVDEPFMEGCKYYIDYVIEYKDFMEQVSNFIKGSPLLVRSLRTVREFKCSLKRHKNIIELYNIPESCKTLDLLRIYKEEPRYMIWCDGSHALLVNQSPEQAKRALNIEHKFIRSRPIEDGSPVATVIACSYELEPVFETLDKWIHESREF